MAASIEMELSWTLLNRDIILGRFVRERDRGWVRSKNLSRVWNLAPLRSAIGVLEQWSTGVMGLEERKNIFSAFATHYSNTPTLHVDGMN